nr:odorant binding protein 8 [Trissolcus basalis]
MKAIAVLAFCIVAVSTTKNNVDTKGPPSKFKTYWRECLLENGLDKDSIKEMMAKQDFSEAGCAIACMHEKLELIDEDGNVIFEKYEESAKHILANFGHTYNDDIKTILIDCNQLAMDIKERCEKFLLLSQCVSQRYLEYFGKQMDKKS